jgi:hypothetical protein
MMTNAECAEHRKKMRAEEQGKTMPEQPPAGGQGMGPGGEMGPRNGMGPKDR